MMGYTDHAASLYLSRYCWGIGNDLDVERHPQAGTRLHEISGMGGQVVLGLAGGIGTRQVIP